MSNYSYEGTRRVSYGTDEGDAVFVPVCRTCGRFVKADSSIKYHHVVGMVADEPNATCSKCGRVRMIHEGWF